VIYVGIDDTDTLDAPGTNQLARALVKRVADRFPCRLIVRHQLLEDPRVPCTSHNGSASILLETFGPGGGAVGRPHHNGGAVGRPHHNGERPHHNSAVGRPHHNGGRPRHSASEGDSAISLLIDDLRAGMREWFVAGSDPGLCVAATVPEAIAEFGRRCQRELVSQSEARDLAAEHGLHLEGLGGTEGGVIGALAAVGLAASGNDGRVVHIGAWPDDLTGPQEIATLHARGIEVCQLQPRRTVTGGLIDVGKHLRPNFRENRVVLFVESAEVGPPDWQAVRLK